MAGSSTKNPTPSQLTPLWVISLFLSLTEMTLGVVATKTLGSVQIALTCFVIGFPILVAIAFFSVLWCKPYAFYPPSAYGQTKIKDFVDALRGNHPTTTTKTADIAEKIRVFGNPDRFALLCKASAETWSRSTKAMEVPGGCLVQVSTQVMDDQGTWNVAEALTYVPGVVVREESGGSGRFITQL